MKAKECLLLLQKILQLLDEGVHVLDKHGNTILYNEAMSALEKMDLADVIKKPFTEVFKGFNNENSTLLKALHSKTVTKNLKQTYLNKDGKEISTINTTIPVIIDEEVVAAVEVAKNITKIEEMSNTILKLHDEIEKPEKVKYKKVKKYNFDNIVGQCDNFLDVIERAKKSSRNSASVFIYGETGTGKELIAQSIHYASSRKDNPFKAQNCAALPESLLEGLLFGTTKGGFTGAVDRAGLFEQANGGTLLLDEINSMPYELQPKLLRVLQENYIRRVGGSTDIPIDVRIITTCNELPGKILEEGKLRKDLFYRLNVISLNVPPLRDRIDDIILLAKMFVDKHNGRFNKHVTDFSDEVYEYLLSYDYPGNVRELENMIMSAVSMCENDEHILTGNHFSIKRTIEHKIDDYEKIEDSGIDKYLGSLEKKIIQKALIDNNCNITRASNALKIKRQTLQHKIKKYNINI
ncbi:MAG: sigma 54-interacting transcriptional regulator [Sedimentibacter sp.]